MKKSMIVFLLTFAFLASFVTVSAAVEVFEGVLQALEDDDGDWRNVIIGVGALWSTSPYEGDDDDTIPVPIIIGEYKNFYADGSSLGYYFKKWEKIALSAVIAPRLMGYEDDDSPQLNGMDDRDATVDGGLRIDLETEYFLASVTGVSDLGNKHQGQEIVFLVSKEFKDGFFTPRVGFAWQSKSLVDYYYGVLGTEALSSRRAYEGDSTMNFVTGFTLGIPFGENWAGTIDFEYVGLGDEISDSTIVDRDEIISTLGGLVYRF